MTGLYIDWRGRRDTCLWEVSVLLWPEENKVTWFSLCFLSLEGMSLHLWCFRIFPNKFIFLVSTCVSLLWREGLSQMPLHQRDLLLGFLGACLEDRGGDRQRCLAWWGGAYACRIWKGSCLWSNDMPRVRILNPPSSSEVGSTAVLCHWSAITSLQNVLNHPAFPCLVWSSSNLCFQTGSKAYVAFEDFHRLLPKKAFVEQLSCIIWGIHHEVCVTWQLWWRWFPFHLVTQL